MNVKGVLFLLLCIGQSPLWAFPGVLDLAGKPSVLPGTPLSLASAQEDWEVRPIRIPPLLWYEKDSELNRRLLMVSMLYWDFQEQSTAHKLLLPVFYHWRYEDRRLLISLPFLMAYQRPQEKWMVAGLFYRQQDKRATRTALFPLYWQKIRANGGRVTVALPFLFYDYRSHDRQRKDQLFLLGWRRRRFDKNMGVLLNYGWMTEPHNRFRTFFPLYWHVRSPGNRLDIFVPFYYRRQDPAVQAQHASWSALSAPSAQEKETEASAESSVLSRQYAGLFPLIGFGWGRDLSLHYLFPLYYYSSSWNQRSFVTLPFSSIRSNDARKGHYGLYFFSHDPDLRIDGIFPLWSRRKSSDDFEDKFQILNFVSRRENEDYFQSFFPFYAYWSNPEETRFLSWGVWMRQNQEKTSGWAYLYHWKNTSSGDSTRIFFPLYWHFWRAPDWGVDVFFPFYTRYRDGDTSVTAIPPFVWKKSPERSTWSFLFLYWHDQQVKRGSTTLFPLFHHHYNPERRMFFAPFFWTRQSALSREGAVPPLVYWYKSQEKKRVFVAPLYWFLHSDNREFLIVPPYYKWKENKRLYYGVFPLWGRHLSEKERGSYVFPFYWYSGKGKGDGLWIVPPLLSYLNKSGTGTDEARFNLQYLLLGNVSKTSDSLSHGFFPLYQYVRKKDFANFWAPRGLALFAWERKGPHRKGYVFPYLWRRSPEKNWDLVVPLWYHSSTYEVNESTGAGMIRGIQTGRAACFFPLFWTGKNQERTYRLFLPLYAHYSEPDRRFSAFTPLGISYDTPRGGKFRMIFPLYWRFLMTGSPDTDKEKESSSEEAAAKRDIVVFGPWFRVDTWKEDRKTRTVGVAPFFSNTYTDPKNKYFEILGGLFGRDVQEGRRRFRFLYFFYTRPKTLSH